MASIAVGTVAYPVIIMTSVPGSLALARSRTSMPSTFSILRSVTTTSKAFSFKRSSASIPLPAVETKYPSFVKTCSRFRRVIFSSSTTRMLYWRVIFNMRTARCSRIRSLMSDSPKCSLSKIDSARLISRLSSVILLQGRLTR